MNKLAIVWVMMILGTGPAVFADLVVPPWGGDDGSTFQQWDFTTSDPTPDPTIVVNQYDIPSLRVNTPFDWIDVKDSHQGIWPLSGEIDIYIPNSPLALDHKEIWLQLIWKTADLCPDPFVPSWPNIAATAEQFDSITIMCSNDPPDSSGWVHSLFIITIQPNPLAEWISVKGDIIVDQLVIDTICIPEPATICLLGLGALSLIRRKKLETRITKNKRSKMRSTLCAPQDGPEKTKK